MPQAFFAARGHIGDHCLESRTVQISSFDALEVKGDMIAPITILLILHPSLKLPPSPFPESVLQLLVTTIVFQRRIYAYRLMVSTTPFVSLVAAQRPFQACSWVGCVMQIVAICTNRMSNQPMGLPSLVNDTPGCQDINIMLGYRLANARAYTMLVSLD